MHILQLMQERISFPGSIWEFAAISTVRTLRGLDGAPLGLLRTHDVTPGKKMSHHPKGMSHSFLGGNIVFTRDTSFLLEAEKLISFLLD